MNQNYWIRNKVTRFGVIIIPIVVAILVVASLTRTRKEPEKLPLQEKARKSALRSYL